MKRLTIKANIDTHTSYGMIVTELFKRLAEHQVYCSIRPMVVVEPFGATIPVEMKSRFVRCEQPEEWEFLIGLANLRPTRGKKTVWLTMHESTVLPKPWVESLNLAKLIIVPSTWCSRVFKDNGVKTKVVVIPLGIDQKLFNYQQPQSKSRFVFGVAGRTASGGARKGVKRAIEIFKATFSNNPQVELQVKVQPDCDIGQIGGLTDSRIKITRAHVDQQAIVEWLSYIDVFVSLATAEGFGLWQLQAMACGKPVMAANYAGLSDFMTDENSFCLPYVTKAMPEFGGGLWADIKDQDASEMMRRLAVQPAGVRALGCRAAEDAAAFTWDRTTSEIVEKFREIGVLK